MPEEHATRFLVSIPPDWLEQFKNQAVADGQTLSEWVCDCCVANLSAADQKNLSTRRKRGGNRRKPKEKK